ncbi:endocuticle structural glycoprotein SgAbd-2-like [Ischnura elegans]|uniref:endocuticle structural glycoprotein SgAbd-2-like n=1 Tax=Ischnura elegans TaxID=197161 RepID=UPI001ED8BBB2|nr:endocuticle structural glycoprotein SgAbd-2-like [Ischnura elegans]
MARRSLIVSSMVLLLAGASLARPQTPPGRYQFTAPPLTDEERQPQLTKDGRQIVTPIPILRLEREQGEDGSYRTSWETGNNIHSEESGILKTVNVKRPVERVKGGPIEEVEEQVTLLVQRGSYSYPSPDGTIITVTYVADENGFRAEGDHLPKAPPVPPGIPAGPPPASRRPAPQIPQPQAEEAANEYDYDQPAAAQEPVPQQYRQQQYQQRRTFQRF